MPAAVAEVQETPRPTALPTEAVAEAGQASPGADRADGGGSAGGGRRSVAAALNAGVAPTASPESPSPTEQNLPRVLWDRPPGRTGAAAGGTEGLRPTSAPSPHAAPEHSPLLPRVVQRGADLQSETGLVGILAFNITFLVYRTPQKCISQVRDLPPRQEASHAI